MLLLLLVVVAAVAEAVVAEVGWAGTLHLSWGQRAGVHTVVLLSARTTLERQAQLVRLEFDARDRPILEHIHHHLLEVYLGRVQLGGH